MQRCSFFRHVRGMVIEKFKFVKKRDRFSVALYATEERSPSMLSLECPIISRINTNKIVAEKKNNEANWMVSNSAKLHRRTKQHTQFGVSASNSSRDMARTKSWRKKKITKRIGW